MHNLGKCHSLPVLDQHTSTSPHPPHSIPLVAAAHKGRPAKRLNEAPKRRPTDQRWMSHSSSTMSFHSSKGLPGRGCHSSSQSTLSLALSSTPTSHTLLPPNAHRFFSGSVLSLDSEQLLDHSHLKPGANAALLSYATTVNMYRENAKKTNDSQIQYDFAIFLVEAAKRLEQKDKPDPESMATNQCRAYLLEAEKLLKQVALRGHAEAQYYLATMYASGLLDPQGEPDYSKAFPFFVQATKHHSPDAAFRAAKCYEDGLGTRRDKAKAVQYYRKSASLNHPGAMYRLGLAEINGELGMTRNVREGHNWLKRSAEAATPLYPHALHELALLHEKGFESVIFADHAHALHLYKQAAALGYIPSALRLGECFELGRLGCKVDPLQSIQFYTIAAEQGNPEACFALTAWYLVGGDAVGASDELAFVWAYKAASQGLPKAEYALGYFYEVGIGVEPKMEEAIRWYTAASVHGEKRASQRLHQLPARFRGSGQQTSLRLHPLPFFHSSTGQPNSLLSKAKRWFVRKPDDMVPVNFV